MSERVPPLTPARTPASALTTANQPRSRPSKLLEIAVRRSRTASQTTARRPSTKSRRPIATRRNYWTTTSTEQPGPARRTSRPTSNSRGNSTGSSRVSPTTSSRTRPSRTPSRAIDKRRLSESDFERAREALEPAAEYADLLEEREAAREEVAEARKAANKRSRALDDEIAERERLLELATADLDAPVERLREPIEHYNEAIREAVQEYRLAASAREVFDLLERARGTRS